jgi:hypothetical protein
VQAVSEKEQKFNEQTATERTAKKDYTVAQAGTKVMAVRP